MSPKSPNSGSPAARFRPTLRLDVICRPRMQYRSTRAPFIIDPALYESAGHCFRQSRHAGSSGSNFSHGDAAASWAAAPEPATWPCCRLPAGSALLRRRRTHACAVRRPAGGCHPAGHGKAAHDGGGRRQVGRPRSDGAQAARQALGRRPGARIPKCGSGRPAGVRRRPAAGSGCGIGRAASCSGAVQGAPGVAADSLGRRLASHSLLRQEPFRVSQYRLQVHMLLLRRAPLPT